MKGKCIIVLYFAHKHNVLQMDEILDYYTFPLLISPLFPSFLHQYCLIPILYATNFLIEDVFITCVLNVDVLCLGTSVCVCVCVCVCTSEYSSLTNRCCVSSLVG